MREIQTYLDETRDLACAPLLRLLVQQVSSLGPDVEPEVGAYGVRFKLGGRLLCELSVFGELFIARVGPHQALGKEGSKQGIPQTPAVSLRRGAIDDPIN